VHCKEWILTLANVVASSGQDMIQTAAETALEDSPFPDTSN
jgi:hypothetical protein